MRDLRIRYWGKDLAAGALGARAEDFLKALGGPSLIQVPGLDPDPGRLRVVSTLLHGNEPSGIRALHRWLGSGVPPAVDTLLIVAAIDAALEAPGFAHRFLPGTKDLNRCWREPFEGEEGRFARQTLAHLHARPPECQVDLHNNTGRNPAYGVTFGLSKPERNLVARYASRIIHTPIELGTIVEATCHSWPTVTVECGRSGDPDADAVALVGTRRILETEALDLDAAPPALEVVVDPVRVCVRKGIDLAFGDGPTGDGRLVISREIDRHNFELVPPGTCIGWLEPGSPWPLEAIGAGGADRARELFAHAGDRVVTRIATIPVMMTTHRENALSDCLFYAARPEAAGP